MRFAYLIGSIALSFFLASSAYAQCTATTCPIGPESETRGQIGNGLPLPITAQLPQFVETTFMTTGGGTKTAQIIWEAGDRVKPINGAFVNQENNGGATPTNNPRSIMMPGGTFKSLGPLLKIPVFLANNGVFQVNTSLQISNPRTDQPSAVAAKSGRTGPSTVTYCPGSTVPTGTPMGGFNPGCLGGINSGDFNGLARYTATKNQFGGPVTGKNTGMNGGPAFTPGGSETSMNGVLPGSANATVYINFSGLKGTQLPCLGGAGCQVAIETPDVVSSGVFGGAFQSTPLFDPPNLQMSAIHTASIGAAGTILHIGKYVPTGGPFGNGAWPKQAVTSYGLPGTTGRLTISVTAADPDEIFIRQGYDGRNANGSGLLSIVGGALSNRTLSGPNANRTWATYWLPEPGALVAGASALMMLGGCHWLVRRRR
jgi:hypothetical protein